VAVAAIKKMAAAMAAVKFYDAVDVVVAVVTDQFCHIYND